MVWPLRAQEHNWWGYCTNDLISSWDVKKSSFFGSKNIRVSGSSPCQSQVCAQLQQATQSPTILTSLEWSEKLLWRAYLAQRPVIVHTRHLSNNHIRVVIVNLLRQIRSQLTVDVTHMFISALLTFPYHNNKASCHQYSHQSCRQDASCQKKKQNKTYCRECTNTQHRKSEQNNTTLTDVHPVAVRVVKISWSERSHGLSATDHILRIVAVGQRAATHFLWTRVDCHLNERKTSNDFSNIVSSPKDTKEAVAAAIGTSMQVWGTPTYIFAWTCEAILSAFLSVVALECHSDGRSWIAICVQAFVGEALLTTRTTFHVGHWIICGPTTTDKFFLVLKKIMCQMSTTTVCPSVTNLQKSSFAKKQTCCVVVRHRTNEAVYVWRRRTVSNSGQRWQVTKWLLAAVNWAVVSLQKEKKNRTGHERSKSARSLMPVTTRANQPQIIFTGEAGSGHMLSALLLLFLFTPTGQNGTVRMFTKQLSQIVVHLNFERLTQIRTFTEDDSVAHKLSLSHRNSREFNSLFPTWVCTTQCGIAASVKFILKSEINHRWSRWGRCSSLITEKQLHEKNIWTKRVHKPAARPFAQSTTFKCRMSTSPSFKLPL